MWEQLAKYNNNFLQTQLNFMKAECINELECREMRKRQTRRKCNMLLGQHETCKNSLYFEDRAQLAYGFWALPQLLSQLSTDNAEVQWKAIKSLSEYVKNPLHAQRAINDFDIIRRCSNLFLRLRLKFQKTIYRNENACLQLFYELSLHRNGVKELVCHIRVIKELYKIINNREEDMWLASKILAMVTRDKCEVVHLTEQHNVLRRLMSIFSADVCVLSYPGELWSHLSHIFEIYPQLAVKEGFFDILFTRIQGRLNNYHIYDLKCFALLMRCSDGQQRFLEVDAIKEMYEILIDTKRKLNNYEYVVQAIMNGVTAKAVLWRCREFINMPVYITNLAKQHNQADMQLLCFQCLRQIGVMPCIKSYMRQNCLEDLKQLECSNEINEDERVELVYWLMRKIYHTVDLRVKRKPITMDVPDDD